MPIPARLLPILLATTLLAACSGIHSKAPEANPLPADSPKGPGLFSGKSGNILDAFKNKHPGDAQTADRIGVSIYLWRAALASVDFMPLQQADSAGGVILTDWYSAPAKPDERAKLNILIVGKTISSNAVKVTMFKQQKVGADWKPLPVSHATEEQLEDAILTKARALRVQAREADKK